MPRVTPAPRLLLSPQRHAVHPPIIVVSQTGDPTMPGIEFLENGRTGGNEMRRCPDEVAGEGDDIQVQLVHRSDIPFQ